MSDFIALLELAKGGSRDKRRELLRQITDVFLADAKKYSDTEIMLFDEIIVAISADLDKQVRVDLARKVAAGKAPLRRTARRLAMDEIDIAHTVIRQAAALSAKDMLEVIAQTTQAHMMAVTLRNDVCEDVASALVDKGSDEVVAALLENPAARISRPAFERIAARAEAGQVLHTPFVRRPDTPLDLMYRIYLHTDGDLRREIMRRFCLAPAETLDIAIAASRSVLPFAYLNQPEDYAAAKEHVAGLAQRGGLKPPVLIQLLREERRTAFLIAFARLVEVDFDLGRRLVEDKDIDGVGMLCRAAKFDRSLFVSMCMLAGLGAGGLSRADVYGRSYDQIPVATAQRVLGFWKTRTAGAKAA